MIPERVVFPSPGFKNYWEEGIGKFLLNKLDKTPSFENVKQRTNLLFEFDETADAVIHEVFLKEGFAKAQKQVTALLDNATEEVSDVHPSLEKLFKEVNTCPQWLNEDLLNSGALFCQRAGLDALIVLRNYCLMGGYESSAINKPLIYTGALKKGAAKRMAETVEFWVNVTGTNALKNNNIGFKSAVQVRLMHAFARVSILKNSDWNNDKWGIPLNQWDMVATNLGFSIVFLEGLKKLGYQPTEKEEMGVYHLWKYIGYLLGIPAHYLPDTHKEAIEELYKWTMCQPVADKDTITLASALVNEPILASYPPRKWQKQFVIQSHLAYNHYFLGKRACDAMRLPETKLAFIPYLNKGINNFKEKISNIFPVNISSQRKKQEKVMALFIRGHHSSLHPEAHVK